METYRIKIAIPSKSNRWEANIEERLIKAENFNYMLMKAFTEEEFKAGARIVRIEKKLKDKYCAWEMIKYC